MEKPSIFRIVTLTAALAVACPAAAQIEALSLPARPVGAKTGSQFKDKILNLPLDEREIADATEKLRVAKDI